MNSKIIALGLTGVVLGFVALSANAAESSCRGLPQDSCTEQSSCRWVSPYKRKDGLEISGYCRTLPGNKLQARLTPGQKKS